MRFQEHEILEAFPINHLMEEGIIISGVKEQIIFTEINYDKIQAVRGINITIATTSKTDNEAYELLKSFGFPLKENL